jgi:hypothetical protein
MSTITDKLAEVRTELKNLRETVQVECAARQDDHDKLLVMEGHVDNQKTATDELKSQVAARYNNIQQWMLMLASAVATAALVKLAEKFF